MKKDDVLLIKREVKFNIYYELALIINKKLYEDNIINKEVFNNIERDIIKKIESDKNEYT